MPSIRVFSLCAACALCLALSALAQTERPPPGTIASASALPASIPYVMQDGLILIKAAVGTGTPQDAVIATGLPVSIISTDLAIRQAIQGQGVQDLPTLSGVARVQNGGPQMVTIGSVTVNNVPLAIFDLFGHLSSNPISASPTVWLGWSALGSLSFTIDPEKREIVIQPHNAPVPQKSMVIPFTVQDGRMYVMAKLNGHRSVRMMVDTASVGTLIPADAARALRLPELATIPVKAAGGKEGRVTAVTLNELTFAGNLKIKDLRALYVSAGDAPDLGMDTGILGTDALLKHRVTINYGRNTMAFEKIESKKDVVRSSTKAPPTSPPAEVPKSQTPGANPAPGISP